MSHRPNKTNLYHQFSSVTEDFASRRNNVICTYEYNLTSYNQVLYARSFRLRVLSSKSHLLGNLHFGSSGFLLNFERHHFGLFMPFPMKLSAKRCLPFSPLPPCSPQEDVRLGGHALNMDEFPDLQTWLNMLCSGTISFSLTSSGIIWTSFQVFNRASVHTLPLPPV